MGQNQVGPGLDEVAEKYPEVPKLILLKIDTGLRGVTVTSRAEALAKAENYLFENSRGGKTTYLVDGVLLRDGTSIGKLHFQHELQSLAADHIRSDGSHPYTLDTLDGQFWLLDKDRPVEQVFFSPIPEFYDKKTSRGTAMVDVAKSGPASCLSIIVFGYCHFWRDKRACKYCDLVGNFISGRDDGHTEESLQDIYETVAEALKEEGRWQIFRLTAGSDPRGNLSYDVETEEYIKVLGAIERAVGSKDFNGRLVGSALHKSQWQQLKDAGTVAVEPHIEVWDKDLFDNICPGKAKYGGRGFWLQSAIDAVEVYGRGNVCSQIVGGAELAQPYGFKTIDAALESSLEGVEYLAQRGVTTSFNVLQVSKSSVFFREGQKPASLEYYARLTKGLRDIRRKYRIPVGFNDYRRCGHPDTSFSRIDFPEAVA